MKIAIIDYGAGNLKSVQNALDFLNVNWFIAREKNELGLADKVILPGVGAASNAMQNLHSSGFYEVITSLKKPFLGICLGLQLLAEFSEEGKVDCLNIISGTVKLLPDFVKKPQIGWNKVNFTKKSPLFMDIPDASYFYFVHSYYFDVSRKYVLGTTDYGVSFPSVIQKNNIYATQFHPEKSGEIGLKLLSNFITKC